VAEHERRRLERRATAVVDAEAATEAAVPAPGVEATGVADH
jgi:hypothetical protein